MKYYLSSDVLHKLVFGEKKIRFELKDKILQLLKKNSRLFTSVFSLHTLISIKLEYAEAIFHELHTLCDEICSVNLEDIKLAYSFRKEYNLNEIESLDLALAIKTCDCILGYSDKLKAQKLIRFICLSSKSKVDRF